MAHLSDIIENNEMYKNKPSFLTDSKQMKDQLEISKNELELTKIKSDTKSYINENEIKL